MFIFGEARKEWKTVDSARRRLEKAIHIDPEQNPVDNMVRYHKNLLRRADDRGFRYRDGRKLSDLELLSSLQHFGAATFLLDFTHNPLVALYIACLKAIGTDDDGQADGKVVIVPERNITRADISHTATKIIEDRTMLRWQPILEGEAERRMMAQSGIFLINYQRDAEDHPEIIIKNDHKEKVLDTLKSHYRISGDTLFMDIAGFARNNSHSMQIETEADNLALGDYHMDQGDYHER